jgi:hypothetical protein
MKLEFCRQIFEKYSDMKFHENPSSGSRVFRCGRTDGWSDRETDRHDEDTSRFSQFCEPPTKRWQFLALCQALLHLWFCDVLWTPLTFCDVLWTPVTYCDVLWCTVNSCDVLWRTVRTGLLYAFRMKAGRYSVCPTNASQQDDRHQHCSVQYSTVQAASRVVSWFISCGNGMYCSSPARLLARPTSGAQVVTRLCKSDIAQNVSFSRYITGRKVKGKVRPACTTTCYWRPTAGARSKQLRAADEDCLGRGGGEQGPKFGFFLRL